MAISMDDDGYLNTGDIMDGDFYYKGLEVRGVVPRVKSKSKSKEVTVLTDAEKAEQRRLNEEHRKRVARRKARKEREELSRHLKSIDQHTEEVARWNRFHHASAVFALVGFGGAIGTGYQILAPWANFALGWITWFIMVIGGLIFLAGAVVRTIRPSESPWHELDRAKRRYDDWLTERANESEDDDE